MKKILMTVALVLQFTVVANAELGEGRGEYCAPTALVGAKAIAKINNPSITKKELKNATLVVVDPDQGNQYEVTVGAMRFVVNTVALDGDCLIGNILKAE